MLPLIFLFLGTAYGFCSSRSDTLPFDSKSTDCKTRVIETEGKDERWYVVFATSTEWTNCPTNEALLIQECPLGQIKEWTAWSRPSNSEPFQITSKPPLEMPHEDWPVNVRDGLYVQNQEQLIQQSGVTCLPGTLKIDRDLEFQKADRKNGLGRILSEGMQITMDHPLDHPFSKIQLKRQYNNMTSVEWKRGLFAPGRRLCAAQVVIRTPHNFWDDDTHSIIVRDFARWKQWEDLELTIDGLVYEMLFQARLDESPSSRGGFDGLAYLESNDDYLFETWTDVMYAWRDLRSVKLEHCASDLNNLPIRPPVIHASMKDSSGMFDLTVTFRLDSQDGNLVPGTIPPCWKNAKWYIDPDKFDQCRLQVHTTCHDSMDWAGSRGHEWKQHTRGGLKTRWKLFWESLDDDNTYPYPYGPPPYSMSWFFRKSSQGWVDTWTSTWAPTPELWSFSDYDEVWRGSIGSPQDPLIDGAIVVSSFDRLSKTFQTKEDTFSEWTLDDQPIPSLFVDSTDSLPGLSSLPTFRSIKENRRSVTVIPPCLHKSCELRHVPTNASFDILSRPHYHAFTLGTTLEDDWNKVESTACAWFINAPLIPFQLTWILLWAIIPLKG